MPRDIYDAVVCSETVSRYLIQLLLTKPELEHLLDNLSGCPRQGRTFLKLKDAVSQGVQDMD